MYYVVQENVFRESNYDKIIETLEKFELPYTVVRIFPFVDKIVRLEDIPEGPFEVDELPDFELERKDVFVFGAIKLARVAAAKGWYPGSMMNSNHDFLVYRDHYGENLLNWDSKIVTINDFETWDVEEGLKFIRPTQDTKSFTGAVFTKYEWLEARKRSLTYENNQFSLDTQIQVSSVKNILKEIRFWVVGGKIITGSQYRSGNRTVYDSFIEPEAIEFAQRMVDTFQLAEAFVIDVCLIEDGVWKVVECGCINCAGFYHSDVQKTIMALEEHFNL
jgi:hypothetical protein